MAATSLEIANNALILIGANTITSLSDATKEARACNARYAPARRHVLRSYPWNFAKKRVTLDVAEVTVPEFGYELKFALPDDYLRTIKVDTNGIDFRVEVPYILTDASSIELLYIYDETDTTLYDPMFENALAAFLAWNICYTLTQSEELRKMMWEQYYGLVKLARHVNATENPAGRVETTQWVDARESPNQGYVRDPQT